MKFGKGAIVCLVGGILGLVSVFLAWVTVSITALGITISLSLSGMQLASPTLVFISGTPAAANPYAGEFAAYVYGVLVLSLLGLIFGLLGKKITAMLALVFGLLTVILAAVAAVRINQLFSPLLALVPGASAGPGIGLYLAIVGGIILLLGGVFAMLDAKKAATAPPMPASPPPM